MIGTPDVYLAYEETILGDLRLNLYTGGPVLEYKIRVRYNFDSFVEVWLPVPIVNTAPCVPTEEQKAPDLEKSGKKVKTDD